MLIKNQEVLRNFSEEKEGGVRCGGCNPPRAPDQGGGGGLHGTAPVPSEQIIHGEGFPTAGAFHGMSSPLGGKTDHGFAMGTFPIPVGLNIPDPGNLELEPGPDRVPSLPEDFVFPAPPP